jgi:Coenzyme PQQ synthesis protein D (PqqD)
LYLLNQTARMMWEELARGVAPDDVAGGLAARFGVPAARVRADMVAILKEWRGHKLLAGAPAPDVAVPADSPPTAAGAPPAMRRRFHAERIYRLCGRPILIRFGEPEMEQALHPPLAHTADPSSHPTDRIDVVRDGAGYLVVCNGADIERAPTHEKALGQVFGRILELSYPDAEWLAMMHAAAVGDESGAVVMAGGGGSGKSTLTAGLLVGA